MSIVVCVTSFRTKVSFCIILLQAVVFFTVGFTNAAAISHPSHFRGLRNGETSELQSEDATSKGSTCVVSCSRDGSVKLWDAESGLCLKTFTAIDAAGGWGRGGAAGAGGSWVRCVCVPETKLRPAPFFASGGNDQRQVTGKA